MADAPVISIVTPSYNQGDFLEKTLISVLTQEGDFFLDYLIIDGASNDGSLEIIRRYADLLEKNDWPVRCRGIRYRWMSEPDNGQSDALMKGFNLAEGEILAWLNSDDFYRQDALRMVADCFQKNPEVALVYGEADYCDSQGEIIGRYPTEDFDIEKLSWFNFFCQPSTFFRKEAFKAVGELDVSLHYGMDYDLFIRLVKSFPCKYLLQVLSCYRLHLDSKTMRNDVLFSSHEEALRLAMRHFRYAPLNLVYGSCLYYCLAHAPNLFTRFKPVVILMAIVCALPRSLWLNKGVRRNDLNLLKNTKMSKLFKDRKGVLLD